jgi:hypothetical protein
MFDNEDEPIGQVQRTPGEAMPGSAAPGASRKAWFGGPPKGWLVAILGVICALVAYSSSFPHHFPPFLLSDWPVMVALLLWSCAGTCLGWTGLLLLCIDLITRAVVCIGTRRMRATDWRWYAPVLLLAGTVWAYYSSDGLVRWRFEANRPALEARAKWLLQQPVSPAVSEYQDVNWPFGRFTWEFAGKVGGYVITDVAIFPKDSVVFLQTGGVFRTGWGFLFDPDGRVFSDLTIKLSALGGGWFLFTYTKT